jgi:hypothetical protein
MFVSLSGEMGFAAGVERFVRVAHRLRSAAPEHDLEIDGFQAVIDVAVDDTGRAGGAFPRAQALVDPAAAFVFEENRQEALIRPRRYGCLLVIGFITPKRPGDAYHGGGGWVPSGGGNGAAAACGRTMGFVVPH